MEEQIPLKGYIGRFTAYKQTRRAADKAALKRIAVSKTLFSVSWETADKNTITQVSCVPQLKRWVRIMSRDPRWVGWSFSTDKQIYVKYQSPTKRVCDDGYTKNHLSIIIGLFRPLWNKEKWFFVKVNKFTRTYKIDV